MKHHYFVGVGAEVLDDGSVSTDVYYLIDAEDRDEAQDILYKYLAERYYEFEYDILDEIEQDISAVI